MQKVAFSSAFFVKQTLAQIVLVPTSTLPTVPAAYTFLYVLKSSGMQTRSKLKFDYRIFAKISRNLFSLFAKKADEKLRKKQKFCENFR
jgi:hypothetical protein